MSEPKPSTVDALRRHLYGNSRFPTWQSRSDQLLAGIEVEYIVAHRDSERRLMRRPEFESFLKSMEKHGFNRNHAKGQPERISKDMLPGYIVIEPDFAYHILEIAFPPRGDPEEIRTLIDPTLHAVDEALASLEFRRLPTGVVKNPIDTDFDAVNLGRLDGFVESLQKSPRAHHAGASDPMFVPNFGAWFAATHVHLNASDTPERLAMLPAMYEVEWLAQSLFSRCRRFREFDVGNARALAYTSTFPDSYELVHVPRQIPASLDELALRYENSMPRLFPHEPVLGVKDMSVIRAKSFGTFEFRSACSMQSAAAILAVAAFRIAQLTYGERFQKTYIAGPEGWQRESALCVARPSQPDSATLSAMQTSLQRLRGIIERLSPEWRFYLPAIPDSPQELFLEIAEAKHA